MRKCYMHISQWKFLDVVCNKCIDLIFLIDYEVSEQPEKTYKLTKGTEEFVLKVCHNRSNKGIHTNKLAIVENKETSHDCLTT